MAHFSRIRSAGFWTYNSTLLHTEMETLDADHAKAVNGDDGGTWAPSAVITIGGSGLTVSGPFTSSGTHTVSGVAVFNNTVEVNNTATVDDLAVVNDAAIQGNLEAQGTTHLVGNVTADADIGCERLAIHGTHIGSNILSVHGAAEITGAVEIGGAVACNDALGVVGTFLALGAATFSNTIGISKAVTATGEGRVRKRYLGLSDADATISINDCDIAFAASGVLTAARTLVVTTTGAAAGDTLTITNANTFLITVRLGSMVGPTITSVFDSAGSPARSAVLVYSGSTWLLMHEIPVPLQSAGRTAHVARRSLGADVGQRRLVGRQTSKRPRLLRLVGAVSIEQRFMLAGEPGRVAAAPCPAGRHVARGAGAVTAAVRVADLRALAPAWTRALNLLARRAHLGGLGVVGGTGSEYGGE